MALVALYLRALGGMPSLSEEADCSMLAVFTEQRFEVLAVGLLAPAGAAIPACLAAALRSMPRFAAEDDTCFVEGCQVLRIWWCVDLAIWCVAVIYAGMCLTLVALFLAETASHEGMAWLLCVMVAVAHTSFGVPLLRTSATLLVLVLSSYSPEAQRLASEYHWALSAAREATDSSPGDVIEWASKAGSPRDCDNVIVVETSQEVGGKFGCIEIGCIDTSQIDGNIGCIDDSQIYGDFGCGVNFERSTTVAPAADGLGVLALFFGSDPTEEPMEFEEDKPDSETSSGSSGSARGPPSSRGDAKQAQTKLDTGDPELVIDVDGDSDDED
jgi:hypothetical protein